MPRNGSGVYSKPAGTTAVPNTTVESAKYNTTIDDLVEDANNARPITSGGTGSGTVGGARTNLGVDQAKVFVTKSGAYTAVAAHKNAHIRFDGAYTLSLTAAATLGAGWFCEVQADGGAVTIDPNVSETINGATTLVVPDGQSTLVWCTGSVFLAEENFMALATKVDVAAVQVFTAAQQAQARSNISASLKGHTNGLVLTTNGSDASNDIDISTGEAASGESDPVLMVLASPLTKRLDANWAVGTNQGGLDTGSVANSTYYIWLIQRSDTGVVDVLFSLSSTAPTMPTNYDRKRLIGLLTRASATNGAPSNRGLVQVEGAGAAPNFACRAWARFTSVTTTNLLGGGNVASLTDLGVGYTRVTFATALPDVNGSAWVTASLNGGGSSGLGGVVEVLTTTYADIRTFATTTGNAVDCQVHFGVVR